MYTYTITGLQNGVATGVFIRSFTGGNYNEDSPASSRWVRVKGRTPPPRPPSRRWAEHAMTRILAVFLVVAGGVLGMHVAGWYGAIIGGGAATLLVRLLPLGPQRADAQPYDLDSLETYDPAVLERFAAEVWAARRTTPCSCGAPGSTCGGQACLCPCHDTEEETE